MAYFRCGGGGVPASVKTDMNAVLNKKFGTSTDYPPTDWAPTVNLMGPLPERTVSASVCAFEDGADDVPTKSLVVTIPPTLSGVSALNEKQTGRNLLPNKTYQRNANTLRLGTDTLDGRLSLKASTYTLSLTSDVVIGSLVYTIGGTSTSITFTSSGTRYYGSFTLSDDTDDIFLHVYKSGGITAENVSDFMLEYGSTAHAYEQYQTPTTYTASLGRTIYGGQADIVNGEGQETYKKVVFDGTEGTGGTPSWTMISVTQGTMFRITVSDKATTSATNTLCSYYTPVAQSQRADGTVSGAGTNVDIIDNRFSSVDAFKTWLAENPVTLVYELATPEPFTFDGQEIPTKLGYNAFWSDEGDTEVTYRADIDLLLGGN